MLAERVCYVVGGVGKLLTDGQNLTQQGVVWIALPHSGNIAPGYPQPKGGSGRFCGRDQRWIQAKLGDELLGVGNR